MTLLAALSSSVAAQEPPAPEPPAAESPDAPTAAAELQERLDALEQQLAILARRNELAAEAEAEKAKSGAGVASAKDGFQLRANDGSWALRLRGYVQLDGRAYLDDPDDRVADTLTLRRVRPLFEGTIGKRFGFRIMPDFGGGTTVLQDAYVDWRFSDAAQLRAGKFKPPFGLERLQSGTDVAFVERALPTALGPNRDLGIQLGGQLLTGRLEYAIGLFNGVIDGGSADSDANDAKDVVARLFASPWKGTPSRLSGLSLGVAASRGDQLGTPVSPGLAAYRTAGQQTFFSYRTDATAPGTTIASGERLRVSPQATFFAGPFGLLAEAVTSEHEVRRGAATASLTNRAAQITAVWVLTGEDASYRWHAPKRPWGSAGTPDPSTGQAGKAGRGSVTLVGRYNRFDADRDSFPTFAATSAVERADGWAVGIDWTLQRQTRLLLDYEVTSYSGRGADRPDEKVLFTRLQIGW